MSYGEIRCHICGVSFNIGRIRTSNEPFSAGWHGLLYPTHGYVPSPENQNDFCPSDAGCLLYSRFLHMLENSSEDFKMLSQHINPKHPPSEGQLIWGRPRFEHIAGGLGCKLNSICPEYAGYNGHAISAEDMKSCNTLQCLILKNPQWRAEPGDQDFEMNGHYFLSGLTEAVPTRHSADTQVFPVRHGMSSPHADNIMWLPDEDQEYVMPFHPTCLEVFKRASLHRHGRIDIDGLADWWALEATYDEFHRFPRHPAVSWEEVWRHKDGDEFLAANPCFITQLPTILETASRIGHKTVDDSCAFAVDGISNSLTDVFSQLPWELRAQILLELGSQDVANLRLASRTFRHLPQSFFRSHTLRHMPWLWEAWSTLDYSFWATTTANDLKFKKQSQRERLADLQIAIDALTEEATYVTTPAPYLSFNKTDWYRLRYELARNQSQLLGLKNRQRIWKDCEEILDRIGRYRREGKIVAGQRVDPQATAQAYFNEERRRNRAWAAYCEAGRHGDFSVDDWA
ncbi:hypothetical protein BKA67DRAFT_614262 [Truncatella angustata]|uniref:F-box domain-containing protein n=1 Tax=Truncatella angustata TaxID=152316 RepID=A0A9P8RF68_9PEZI|nr:uncharacterized protein BKA67DRAFT_614262 [Truncatella angustata]KAH6643341.1 hypothetical protein BKA67DRAFT_614262 [Truncatella angustata]